LKKVICIFCKEEKEKSKEHIWPKWLQIEVGGNTKGIYTGTYYSMINPFPHSTRKHVGDTLVLGDVCKDCNNGWMSKLEEDFKPILSKLLSNKQYITSLTKSERHSIAVWSFKTAMVINAGSNYRKIIPDNHYFHLYKHQTVIKNVKIDLGFIKSKNELLWIQSPVGAGLMRTSEKELFHNLLISSYKISLQIKSLGIRVTYFPTAKETGYQIEFNEENKSIRIWPYLKNPNFNYRSEYEDIRSFDIDCFIKPAHNTAHKQWRAQ